MVEFEVRKLIICQPIRIWNIDQGMMNDDRSTRSKFGVRYSVFDIHDVLCSIFTMNLRTSRRT
jgi:hypothetical protein